MEDLIIDENNFEEYFFDVRFSKPKPGQVMARYIARADLMDGPVKRDVIRLLIEDDFGAKSSAQILQKLVFATEKDGVALAKAMAQDLYDGMDVEDVAKKPYRYTLERFFYTEKRHLPTDDPHWQVIELLKTDLPSESECGKIVPVE